jgi:riboflavin synthase alpha subunit
MRQVTSIGQSKDPARPLLSFDVISETLRATNLGDLEMNSSVNFERCVFQLEQK